MTAKNFNNLPKRRYVVLYEGTVAHRERGDQHMLYWIIFVEVIAYTLDASHYLYEG